MKALLCFFLLSISFLLSYSQSGNPDATFGTNGIVITTIGVSSVIYGMVIQSDGKIVVAGSTSDGTNTEFALARYNPNGNLDNTFDGDGIVITNFGSQAEAFCMAIQNDGKIVAAGYHYTDSSWEFAIARYNINGTLDITFDGDGKLTTAIGTVDDEIKSIAIQSDGKIVVTGYVNESGDVNSYQPELFLARYNTDGSLDSTFNHDGILDTDPGSFNVGNSLLIQPDGKIVVGGTHIDTSTYNFLLLRYNTDGSFDSSFISDDGFVNFGLGYYDIIHTIVQQPDGKIVAAGISGNGSNYDFSVARYYTNGYLDSTSFGTDGRVTTPMSTFYDEDISVAVDTDGKILVAAESSNSSTNRDDLALVRYMPNGSLDSTFGIDGKVITILPGTTIINAMKLTPSRIYTAGSDDHFMISVYQNNVFVLPVNLLSFTGALQNGATKLQWHTPGKNISRFKIERSNDGTNFTNIGEVPAAINSSVQTNYLFTDNEPLHEFNFYRLKIIDGDGRSSYSNIVLVKLNGNNPTMKIFPNPATDVVQILLPSTQNETITLQISNAGGKIIYRELLNSIGTNQSINVDVSTLQKGEYFLSVKTKSGIQVQKLIKQ